MHTLDKINNQLITYAFNRAEEIRKLSEDIKDNIIKNQPKNNVPNKPLNISCSVDYIKQLSEHLAELEELSTKVYRYNKGLEKEL